MHRLPICSLSQKTMKSELPQTDLALVRIVVIDEHELFRAGIRMLLEKQPGFAVVGEGANGTQALDIVKHEQPDIVLLDLDLHDGDGLELLPNIFAISEMTRVLALTSSRDPEVHRRAVQLGAIGVVSKNKPPDLLMKAIERVHAGEAWLDRSMTASVLRDMLPRNQTKKVNPEEAKIATLTERERGVIKLVGEGLKNKQIAERLFISDITVHHHLSSIYSKLSVSDRLELLIYAYRHGLATLPH